VQEPIVAQELPASMMATTHGLNELFYAHEVLEVPASKWAAEKATKGDIRMLHTTLNEIENPNSSEVIDYNQLQALNAKLQLRLSALREIVSSTRHSTYHRMSMENTIRLSGRKEILRIEHNLILDAIESGDGALAGKLSWNIFLEFERPRSTK